MGAEHGVTYLCCCRVHNDPEKALPHQSCRVISSNIGRPRTCACSGVGLVLPGLSAASPSACRAALVPAAEAATPLCTAGGEAVAAAASASLARCSALARAASSAARRSRDTLCCSSRGEARGVQVCMAAAVGTGSSHHACLLTSQDVLWAVCLGADTGRALDLPAADNSLCPSHIHSLKHGRGRKLNSQALTSHSD
jgi:hypothetical protein